MTISTEAEDCILACKCNENFGTYIHHSAAQFAAYGGWQKSLGGEERGQTKCVIDRE